MPALAPFGLSIPPKVPVTIQQGTPVTGLLPPGFTYACDVKSLVLGQSFELIWFVPPAAVVVFEKYLEFVTTEENEAKFHKNTQG
ncbi:hypothetical protein DUI87_23886 [Hirundo rustica rustica]|uniref:Uncharacterized protein n=1 Tax=Hirundo rustica rustica TaxID=333673 RepID=A0A3M0JKQ3_HIRRU|nr:hypothetical protein DUI87_23886 [Hirundo rustica rustica]